MRRHADVVIIGAGVTGAALAYELAKRGIRDIVILERKFPCAGATGRCCGGIRQRFTTPHNIRLAMESVKRYETLSEELGGDIEFIQGGYLILAETEGELEAQRKAVALQNELGLPSRLLSPEEALKVLPLLDISTVVSATYCPTDGHANPFRVVEGFLARAREYGRLPGEVHRHDRPGGETRKGHRGPHHSSLRFMGAYARELLRYVPAFGQLTVLRQWAGLYDVTPDAQPILGPTPGLEDLIQANGYSGHGFMIAPAVARHLADYIEKGIVSEILRELSLERFERGLESEAFVVG